MIRVGDHIPPERQEEINKEIRRACRIIQEIDELAKSRLTDRDRKKLLSMIMVQAGCHWIDLL